MKQFLKILHRSSCLRLCRSKDSPRPQRMRGREGTPGFPAISGGGCRGCRWHTGEGREQCKRGLGPEECNR